MRISDWSSDVCSSDLILPLEVEVWRDGPIGRGPTEGAGGREPAPEEAAGGVDARQRGPEGSADRKRVVAGKSGSGSLDSGGRRFFKKKNRMNRMKSNSRAQ